MTAIVDEEVSLLLASNRVFALVASDRVEESGCGISIEGVTAVADQRQVDEEEGYECDHSW